MNTTTNLDLTGKYVWQIDYPGDTQPTYFIEDPTTGMFNFAQDNPCRVRYLTDLVGEIDADQLRELAIKAPIEGDLSLITAQPPMFEHEDDFNARDFDTPDTDQ